MPVVNLHGLGSRGLNTDTPAQQLDHTYFTGGNNLRYFDGSIQAVLDFGDNDTDIVPEDQGEDSDLPRNIYSFAQWTQSGEGQLNVAYFYNGEGDATDLTFQAVEDLTNKSDSDALVGAVAASAVDDNKRFGLDFFVFNEVLVVNDGVNHPVWLEKNNTIYRARLLPGWPSGAVGATITGNTDYLVLDLRDDSETLRLTKAQWITILGSDPDDANEIDPSRALLYTEGTNAGFPIVGQRITTLNNVSLSVNQTQGAALGTPVVAERLVPFNNRIVALNISEEYLGDEEYGNTTMLWSTQISDLGTLEGITFAASSSNSAGDDIITETVGEILDAGPLGNQLMIYKEDAVFYCADTGDPLYLVTQLASGDDGIYSPNCFTDIGGNRHLVMGNYGVYTFDGGIQKHNVSRGRIEKNLYESVNPDLRDRSFVFHHKADKEAWICVAKDEGWVFEEWNPLESYSGDTEVIQVGTNLYQLQNSITISEFSSSAAYALGDFVYDNNNNIYEVTTAVAADSDSALTDSNFTSRPTYFSDIEQWVHDDGESDTARTWTSITQAQASSIATTGCNRAFIYNYELDTWYTRSLPIIDGNGIRGIEETELNGELKIFGWGRKGVFELSSERLTNPNYLDGGSIEFTKQNFGTTETTKAIQELNPHCGDEINISLGMQDYLQADVDFGSSIPFNPATDYKKDYRLHGRYFNLKVEQDGSKNPELTGIDVNIKPGGRR